MKNQLKKSLSLIMAVLMVLSCWVWVAPTKAEAASNNYTVTIGYNVTNKCEDGYAELHLRIAYKTNNGTSSEIGVAEYSINQDSGKFSETYQTWPVSVPGFPIYFEMRLKAGKVTWGVDSGGDVTELDWDSIKIGSKEILTTEGNRFNYEKGGVANTGFGDWKGFIKEGQQYSGNASGDNLGTQTYDMPYPASVEGFSGDFAMTIPDITTPASSAISSPSSYSAKLVDQYDTYLVREPEYFLSQVENGSPEQDLSDKEAGFWLEKDKSSGTTKVTVKINSDMQKNLAIKSGYTKDYYLIAYGEGNDSAPARAAKKITVTYPRYDWYFDAKINGSSQDLTIMVDRTDADGNVTTGAYTETDSDNDPGTFNKKQYLAYNQKSSVNPVSAERPGFEFLGFWTKPQPTTGNSSAYTAEKDFVYPTTEAEYEALSAAEKNSYYNAEAKWAPKGETAITTGNKEYYAWFLSGDVTVKFYDIDGKYLGTAETKAGYDNTSITWAKPAYEIGEGSFDSGYIKYSKWTGKWKSTKGEIVNPEGYVFSEDLMLIPEFSTVELSKDYKVQVYSPEGLWDTYTSDTYKYRDVVEIENVTGDTKLTSGTGLLKALENAEKNDSYVYSFVGWSTKAPTTGKNYHIVEEDTSNDENGQLVTFAEDFVVRDDSTFYPVYRRVAKEYEVTFEFYNEAGETVTKNIVYKYGAALEVPDEVLSVYASGGREYTLTGWYKGSDFIDNESFKNEKCSGTTTYYADYSSKAITEYNVTFEYRDQYNTYAYYATTVPVRGKISADVLNDVLANVYEIYDDGETESYFKGNWTFEGASKNYSSAELLNYTVNNNMTIKAVYEDGIPFRTVKYVDGNSTQSFRILQGTPITPWTVTVDGEVKDYIPVKAKDEHGVYEFAGWFDEEQTSTDFSVTNGNKYEVGTQAIGDSDLTLYPQFIYNKYNYNYKFYDADGKTEIYSAVLHYGDGFTATEVAAEAAGIAAAADKTAADNTYEHVFVGWDKKLPEFCEGGEPDSTVSFVAQYRTYYKYYTVEWYGDYQDGVYFNYDSEGNRADEGTPFATGKYIYDAKIFTPYESFNAPAPTEEMAAKNQTYAFSKWCYIDENGEVKDYTRDLRINGNMKFFAKYEPTDVIRTVTVVVDEKTTYTVNVKDGAVLTGLVSEPIAGYKDETYHNEFVRWYTLNGEDKVAFDVDATEVNADITIYAEFTVGNHVWDQKEITKAPTFRVKEVTVPVYDEDGNQTGTKVVVPASDGKGEYIEWCECSKEKTWKTADTKIDALVDTIAPAGTAYVGTKWNGADGTGEAAVLVSPSTDLIITTTDKAEANQTPAGFDADLYKYNTAGQGIGIETIKLSIKDTHGNAVVTDSVVYSWAEIQKSLAEYYESWDKVPEIYKHYNANATAKLGTFDLENGVTYVATYVITDINGNSTTVSTVPFTYDDVAPVITVADKYTVDGEKFCGKVEFTATDTNIVTVTAGGHTLRNMGGIYEIAEAGYYNVVAVDEAGNKSSTYVQVIKGAEEDGFHTFKPYRVDATCEAAGYETRKCEICGYEDVKTPIAQLQHDWKVTDIKPTCETDGEKTQKCALCGTTEILAHGYTDVTVTMGMKGYTADNYDPAYSRTGHAYGEAVVAKAPNCKYTGVSISTCANCGDTIRTELPTDENAHSYYTPKIVKATCTTDGKKTQKCRYCGVVDLLETYPATGHSESADYKVILEPGCEIGYTYEDENGETITVEPAYGLKAKYCTACGIILEDTITSEGEDMKPHNNHKIYLAETVEPGVGTKGKYTYKCENCSYVKVVELDALEQFTVIFKDDKGNVIDKITKYKGESITITDPTKEDSKDGKYRYVFAGWYTGTEKKDDEGNFVEVIYDSTEYVLPLEATQDITLYAKFNDKVKLYTLQFVSATGYTEELNEENELEFNFTYTNGKVDELQGTIGDNRAPSFSPKLAGDLKYTFEFEGWYTAKGEKLSAIAVDDLGTADKTYYANYTKKEVGYTVIFMEDAKNAIYKAPEKVTDAEGNDITPVIPYGGSVSFVATVTGADGETIDRTPVKASDSTNHYTFNNKWYTDSACTTEADLTDITEDMVVYAGFTATAHDYDTKVIQAQSCDKAEITEYKCKDENCGYTYTSETKPAAGHTEGEPVYDEETGENIYYCTVESCRKEIRREKASYLIKFVNFDGKTIKNLTVEANGDVKYDYNEYGTPERKADAQYSYTFSGWISTSSNTKYAPDAELPDATADEIYKADYSKADRYYNVTFATENNVAIKSFSVKYGGSVEYAYTEAEFGKPAANIDGHYEFDGWDKATDNITGDTLVRPVFKQVDHTFDGGKETGANCTTPGGIRYTCTACGYYKMGTETVPATGHKLVLNEEKSTEPDYTTQTDGKQVYECVNPGCDYEEEVIISAKLAEIKVTVKDTAGNPVQNALVQLFNKADGQQKGADRTGTSGVVTFFVQPGEYTVTVKVDGVGDTSYDVSVDKDGNTTGNQSQVTIDKPVEEDHGCECSCHRDNFWGAFFRFFQKIIKLFTGKASCCADPDSRI